MDNRTCYCRNPQCKLHGRVGRAARLKFRDWHRDAMRFEYLGHGQRVSARAGTAYAGVRTELSLYQRGVRALAEGLSIGATGRLLAIDKDAVLHWLPIIWRHCQGMLNASWIKHVIRRLRKAALVSSVHGLAGGGCLTGSQRVPAAESLMAPAT